MGEITKTSQAPRCLRLAMPGSKSIETYMNHTDGELFRCFFLLINNHLLYVIRYAPGFIIVHTALCAH